MTIFDFLSPLVSAILTGLVTLYLSRRYSRSPVTGEIAMIALHRMYGIPMNVLRTMTTDEQTRDLVTEFVGALRDRGPPTPEQERNVIVIDMSPSSEEEELSPEQEPAPKPDPPSSWERLMGDG